MKSNVANRLGYLDGLRGIAAAWVLVGHAMILGQWKVPLLSSPEYAVDLFMLLSGFLMNYHRYAREAQEPFDEHRTWLIFWTRRFFRIAPVYYILFAAAILLGPYLGACRDQIAQVFPATATNPARYLDQSWGNILSHVGFVFGISPYYHYRSALPDWSIGLEMQFYAVFPFLVLCMSRLGILRSCCLLVALCLIFSKAAPGFSQSFEMPSFLPLKLNLFLAGMVIAAAMHSTPSRMRVLAIFALMLAAVPLYHGYDGIKPTAIRVGSTLLLAALSLHHLMQLPVIVSTALNRISTTLGRGLFYFMGEMSYSVYLVHLMVMLPVAGFIATHYGDTLPAPLRVMACLLVVIPVSYGISWLLHISLEKRGIALGRTIVARLRK